MGLIAKKYIRTVAKFVEFFTLPHNKTSDLYPKSGKNCEGVILKNNLLRKGFVNMKGNLFSKKGRLWLIK